jgi:hypothetical protein
MTDVLTRPDDIAGAQRETSTPAEPGPPPASTGPGAAVVALASFTAAAGLIHLVMTPSHVGESALEGAGFLVAAWVQLGLAIAVVRAATPRRGLLGLAVAVNLALIGLWAVSRTAGLPLVGDHAGHAATVSLVDGATVVFEAAAVLVAVALLRRPGLGAHTGGAAALAVPLVVMALTSAVVASPSARDHAAGSHGEHAVGAHDDAAMAGGHAHGDGTAVPEDDRGWSLLTNGHDHGATELVELDDATQANLDDELAVTGELVARYPTAAEAMAAGYRRAGPFTPGLGTHYVGGPMKMVSGTMDRDELLSPILIFDGPGAEAPLAGFMYLSIGTQTPPEGFAGPNDHWHYHENVCLIPRADGGLDTPFGADETEVTESMCTEIGGRWLPVVQNMVHVWTVPGYEHPDNVFGDLNPAITCPDGSYYRLDWRESGTRPTLCVNP